MYKSKKICFFCLLLVSGITAADPGGRSFSMPSRNRANIQIPKSCVIKAQAMVGSTAMSEADKSASKAFVNVLTSAGTMLVIDYVLTPSLVQQGGEAVNNQASPKGDENRNPRSPWAYDYRNPAASTTTTEISIKGYLGTMQLTLVQASGQSYSSAQIFNSTSDAQASASTSVASNLVQTSSNQATINMDVLATNIQRLYTMIGISSDLQSQTSLSFSGGAAVTGDPATGLPTALTHALTLADIVSHIDVKAIVTFDGTNLLVNSQQTNVGC